MNDENFWYVGYKLQATRASSGLMINRLKNFMPNLIGGTADFGLSNETIMKDMSDFSEKYCATFYFLLFTFP